MINLELQDLTATPVDIETFIKDPEYLGKVFKDIYPYWLGVLKDVYADPFILLFGERSEIGRFVMYALGITFVFILGVIYGMYGV